MTLYLTVASLHLLGAVVWIGGMLFLGLVLTPTLRARPPAERAALLSAVGQRFAKIGWAALGILLVTGPVLLERPRLRDHAGPCCEVGPGGGHPSPECPP